MLILSVLIFAVSVYVGNMPGEDKDALAGFGYIISIALFIIWIFDIFTKPRRR